jgi:serine/threonine protein kinase
MVKAYLEKGAVVDGFLLEELLHKGGMARLWRVSRPDFAGPILMKVPILAEGEDPAAIVSFEMEQMILPRLSGVHVPKVIAVGDFTAQPYIVMELIEGQPLLKRLPELPLPYWEVAETGVKIATALDSLHRQHVIHLDIKPSNVIMRTGSGKAALIDFGLSRHEHLPDLMHEEFLLPYGTAPYMSPEQLLNIRHDPRSDIFSLGVLLYFFSTGVRPFGTAESLRGMRRRLWRDPVPPRKLRPDYPPWLQEIVLRCLEVEPAWRHPTAAQLAFDLSHHSQIKLTARSERMRRDPWMTVLRRRFNTDLSAPAARPLSSRLVSAPIVAIAVDLAEGAGETNDALRTAAERTLRTLPSARLACVNVLKQSRIAIDSTLDEQGHNKHVDRLVSLKNWAEPLQLAEERVTFHVLEAVDPAAAILGYAEKNRVDHILIGARQSSLLRTLLGSVSARVAAEASCTVTIVRPVRDGKTRKAPPEETAVRPETV